MANRDVSRWLASRTAAFTALLFVLVGLVAGPGHAAQAPAVLATDGSPVVATLHVSDALVLDQVVTTTAEDTISTAVVATPDGQAWLTWTDHAGVLPHNDPGSPFAAPARLYSAIRAQARTTLPAGEWRLYLAASAPSELTLPSGNTLSGIRAADEMEFQSRTITPDLGVAAIDSTLAITRSANTTSMSLGLAVVDNHQAGMHGACLTPAEDDPLVCDPVTGVGAQGYVVSGGGIGQGYVAPMYFAYDGFMADRDIVAGYTVAAASLVRYAYHAAFSLHH